MTARPSALLPREHSFLLRPEQRLFKRCSGCTSRQRGTHADEQGYVLILIVSNADVRLDIRRVISHRSVCPVAASCRLPLSFLQRLKLSHTEMDSYLWQP